MGSSSFHAESGFTGHLHEESASLCPGLYLSFPTVQLLQLPQLPVLESKLSISAEMYPVTPPLPHSCDAFVDLVSQPFLHVTVMLRVEEGTTWACGQQVLASIFMSKALGQIGILTAIDSVWVGGACCQWTGGQLHTALTGLGVNQLPNVSQGYMYLEGPMKALCFPGSYNCWNMVVSSHRWPQVQMEP